jgi:serine/threonine-protein kinase
VVNQTKESLKLPQLNHFSPTRKRPMINHNLGNAWVGKKIADRFDVIKPISNNGMGVVFLAFDNNLLKNVILKTPLIRDSSVKAEITERFIREIYALTTLEHPFIVPFIYTGVHDDHPFAVSRYINGGDLRDKINHSIVDHETHTLESLYAWVPKISDALTYMHANDWIHCDIKPDNILFDTNHNCYLTDFGISKHLVFDPTNYSTSASFILGSPIYMAPEQHLGHKPTPKFDQFSLGVVIYEALCNKLPFYGRTPSAILLDIIRANVIPLESRIYGSSITTSASNAIMKALHFDPDQRHESIAVFIQELFQDLNGTRKNSSCYYSRKIEELLHPQEPSRQTLQETSFNYNKSI